MNIRINKLTLSIGLLGYLIIGLLFLMPYQTYAEGLSLGVNPPIIQVSATPPTAIRHPLTIQNNSDNPVTLSITLRPFTTDNTLGQVTYLDEKDLHLRDSDIFQKIQILDDTDTPVSEVTLNPNQSKDITLKIGLPKDEPPADYYFSIVFISQNSKADANGSSIAGGIASNVLLSIGPKDPATGFIEKFSAPLYVTNGPIPFTVIVHNLSHYYIAPQGQILIRNLYGQLIGKVDLLQQNILANSSRNLKDISQILPDKALWPEEFLFGPYQATLTIALSPQGPVFHRTIYFFAMPLQYLIGLFILVVIAIFLFTRVKKRLRQTV